MEKIKDFKISENIYVCLTNKDENSLIAIEFLLNENSTEVIINGKIMNVNEIEKWIFFELVSGLLFNTSITTEDLLKPFKNLKSKVPVKKQLQKSIHNLRNQLPELLDIDKEKKHELILTKRKTQFTKDTTYRLYIPEWEVKGFVKNIKNIKGLLAFCKQLLNYNNEIYLKEIFKASNKIIELLKKEYSFYLPLLHNLEDILKSYDLFGLNTQEQNKVYAKLMNELEDKFISNTSGLLNESLFKIAKPFLGYYYGYNFATSGEDKISQNIQKIYIDKDNNLKSKQISSDFKYTGSVKVEDNYLFTYAELIGEKGFVQEVLNKPIVATTELKFLLGSFTAFSVDRKLCFGKRILIKIDNIISLESFKTGYLNDESKEQLAMYFSSCFENVKGNITKVKLPYKLDLDIRNIKVTHGKTIDQEWLTSDS